MTVGADVAIPTKRKRRFPMPLSWNEIRARALEFSREWADESSEDAEGKSFCDGFINVFGITRRRVASFEKKSSTRSWLPSASSTRRAGPEKENALRINRSDVVDPKDLSFILGNPPFVGKQHQSAIQKADMETVFDEAQGEAC